MPIVKLIKDSASLLYAFTAIVNGVKPVKFIMDTGTERTSLSEDTAKELGIDTHGAVRARTLGATGFGSQPTIPKISLIMLEEGSITANVELENVHVLEMVTKTSSKSTPYSRSTRTASFSLPNLAGIDLLQKLNARAIIDPSGESRIEW